jgi:tripartite-type tricarboxylate transporter receptor subunit TctC
MPMNRRDFIASLAVPAFAAIHARTSFAATPYPVKPIRMIVPFTSGSTVDTIARIIAGPLSQRLGQQVIIETRPGADGAIAGTEVARAAPDGYTLMLATNSPLNAVPTMHKTSPYDPIADFTPISMVGRYLHFLLVNNDVPAQTLKDFLDYARTRPGKLNFGSGGTFHIVSTAELMKSAGIKMEHVYYKGEPEALVDLIAGRLQFMVCTQGTSLTFVKSGKLRALASTNSKRSASAPDVPTLTELGMPPFSIVPWMGVFGPAKMDPAIVARLNDELRATLADPSVAAKISQQAIEPEWSTPAGLGQLVKDQMTVWRTSVRELGLQAD